MTKRLNELSKEVAAWSPSPAQSEKAAVLADYLNEVSPSLPGQTQTNLTSSQTPMSTETLSSLIAGLAPASYGRGRHASHIRKNTGGIRRVIVAAGVLANEQVRVRGRYTPEGLKDLASTMSETDFKKFVYETQFAEGLQHASEFASLGRVNAALLYEPLRLYRDLTQAAPSLARSALSELTEQAA